MSEESVLQRIRQILKQNASLCDKNAKELETVLTTLGALPFKDEIQLTSFLEDVQRLQGYHVIELFNLGVTPLQKCLALSSAELMEEVIKLFEICFSFCYATDVPKRVSFDYCVRALEFCFPSEPKQCLSTAVVSKLLQLVQVFQEGNLAQIVLEGSTQEANSKLQIRGTNYFFGELLQIFESRRHEDCLMEIIEQTVRIASADAQVKCIQKHEIGKATLQSEHVVSPIFLTNWMKLLKITHASSGFAAALAKVDRFNCKWKILPLMFSPGVIYQESSLTGTSQSTVAYFLSFLEETERNGSEINLPNDKERLDIFFNHLNYFCNSPYMTRTSLELLSATSISNEVLRDVLDQFFYKDGADIEDSKKTFEIIFKVLSLLPDGEVVKKVLKLWRATCSDDPGYETLVYLLDLFNVEESNSEKVGFQERAERTLDFLQWLPCPLLRLISFWQGFLSSFIRIFPTTFQRRPEVLVFIHKALLAARMPDNLCQIYVDLELGPTLQLLEWLSQQSCTEELKSELIWLLMCSRNRVVNLESTFTSEIMKSLSLCPQLSFNSKKRVMQELTYLEPSIKEEDQMVLKECIENLASNQTLEPMDEMVFEFLDFIQRFAVHQMPEDVLELLTLLSRVSISSERRVKVMQLSKRSSEGLQNGLRILQLIEMQRWVIDEGTNEYFDLLFAAIFKTLEGDNDLCEQFCRQHRFDFPSSDVLNVWTFVVAGLISLGLFKEEIDSRCCCHVLQEAFGFSSPCEILQLLSQVRSTAARIVHLSSRGQVDPSSSCNARQDVQESSTGDTDLLENFVASVTTILSTDMLSSREQMLLVKKACDVVLNTPDVLTTAILRNALTNLICYNSRRQSTASSNNEDINLEFNCIVTVMENPTVLIQLSRIPESVHSLCDVLSAKMSNTTNFVDIFLFIGSLKGLHQAFFDHLLPFLEVVIEESMSVEDLLELLKELVQVLRNLRSEKVHITMFNFAFLLQNLVNKRDRDIFLTETAMRWEYAPNHRMFSFLGVPQLLWKAWSTTSTTEKRYEMIDRVQGILKKSTKVEDWVMSYPLNFETTERYITRRIAYCELEWLVFHSCLSTDDAALAFDLSCLSFQRVFYHNLRCFTFADVQISENGVFMFVPEGNKTALKEHVHDKSTGATTGVAVASTGHSSQTTQGQKPILTPAVVAKEVLFHLKRVLGQGKDLSENAFLLWDLVFDLKKPFNWCDAECISNYPVLDDYVDVLLSILAQASSIEMMFHWARLDQHHVCQCSEVILKACKWKGDDFDKEALLKFQTVISTTLAKMRLNTRTTLPNSRATIVGARCFRLLKPQLIHMRNMLESRLPIEVTKRVLDLYQINVEAGVTVGEIVTLWSCKQQSLELVEGIQSFCKGEEIFSLSPAQSEFAWLVLKAFGRLCMNSCENLLAKFKELIELYDPEDAYGLNRLPKWREMMIADGFSAWVIDSWCAAFLITPLKDLTSRDVDAIVDLNSHSLGLVTSVSQIIKQCIFPEGGFCATQGVSIKENRIKERIRLARLLGEFINILKLRKSEENPKDAFVRDIVLDACFELCTSHENMSRKRNDLYKIHGQKLKALFTEVFGKRHTSQNGQVSIQGCGMTHQTCEQELRVTVSVGRQSSYPPKNLPSVLSHTQVYEPMLVLLRRWLSGIVTKPTLASRILDIVQLLFSLYPSDMGPDPLKELHGFIQTRILSLEGNQSLMAQLESAGYNQRSDGILDLWSSRAVELPCYLSRREPPNSRLFTKKLARVLRLFWNEWKNILLRFCIASVKVGEDEVRTKDLFGVQASLDEMEEQAAAVKEVVKRINSEDLDRRVKLLMRLEQQHRARIEKLYKSNRVSEGHLLIKRTSRLSFGCLCFSPKCSQHVTL